MSALRVHGHRRAQRRLMVDMNVPPQCHDQPSAQPGLYRVDPSAKVDDLTPYVLHGRPFAARVVGRDLPQVVLRPVKCAREVGESRPVARLIGTVLDLPQRGDR